jgi:hypothetical protein
MFRPVISDDTTAVALHNARPTETMSATFRVEACSQRSSLARRSAILASSPAADSSNLRFAAQLRAGPQTAHRRTPTPQWRGRWRSLHKIDARGDQTQVVLPDPQDNILADFEKRLLDRPRGDSCNVARTDRGRTSAGDRSATWQGGHRQRDTWSEEKQSARRTPLRTRVLF